MNRVTALLFAVAFAAAASAEPPEGALWNAERTAAATSSPSPSGTQIHAFLQQRDGSFLKVDLSQVEGANFARFGRQRSEYDRFETKPIEWSTTSNGLLQLTVRTQAWKSGQRYTTTEPLLIEPTGKVLWR